MVRILAVPLVLSLAVACASETSLLSADETLAFEAVAGEEELFRDGDFDPQFTDDMQPLFRACDAMTAYAEGRDRADSDGDGTLSDDEQAEVTGRADDRPPRHQALVKFVYDADDDHTLSDDERATMLGDFTARCEAMHDRLLEEFDADGDGTLSDEEEAEARATMEERKPEHEGCGGEQGAEGDEPPMCPPPEDRPEGDTAEPPSDQQGPPPGDQGPPPGDQQGSGMQGPPPGEAGDCPPPPPVPREVAEQYDTDASGTLDADEKAALRADLRERIRGGERPLPPPDGSDME